MKQEGGTRAEGDAGAASTKLAVFTTVPRRVRNQTREQDRGAHFPSTVPEATGLVLTVSFTWPNGD